MRNIILFVIINLFLLSCNAYATFEVSIDDNNNFLDFGAMEIGEARELADKGAYHHQINCTSTNRNTWYLKLKVLRPFSSGTNTIPLKNFEWIVQELNSGKGAVHSDINRPTKLTSSESLVYTSNLDDNTGTQVKIRMRYRLVIPTNQIAGTYNAHLQYIMLEQL